MSHSSPHVAAIVSTALILQSVSTDAFVHIDWIRSQRCNSPRSSSLDPSEIETPNENNVLDEQRRQLMSTAIASCILSTATSTSSAVALSQINLSSSSISSVPIQGIHDSNLRNYYNPNLPDWHGTSLNISSLESTAKFLSSQQHSTNNPSLPMGKWPDPILRRAASPIPPSVFTNPRQLEELNLVALALKNTARKEGAVGLAAQQCGIDASLIFIDGVTKERYATNAIKSKGKSVSSSTGNNNQDGIFLINPRIIKRSPESEMLVWTEECLVLPPEFRATLLRDAIVTIEYETLGEDCGDDCGTTKQITLKGELARCAQHEMDHDRGVLIVDHVSLDELLSVGDDNFMARIEDADGMHRSRMQRAYERDVSESVLLPPSMKRVPLAYESYDGIVSKVTEVDCHDNNHGLVESKHKPMSWLVKPAYAADASFSSVPKEDDVLQTNKYQGVAPTSSQSDCDETCREQRKAIIEKRRAMMQQSRSNTNRGDVLKLSEQRAALYGAKYGGLPSKACSTPGFCP